MHNSFFNSRLVKAPIRGLRIGMGKDGEEWGRMNKGEQRVLLALEGCLAVRTGLEPATSCVTGRHSNQLN